MMKRVFFLTLCVVFLGSHALELDEIIDRTLENYENLTSFYAEFDQISCDEVTGTCTSYQGTIYFVNPNFFRMETKEPKQVYVGDSVSLWIYIPDEKKAIRQRLGQVPFQLNPDMFLKNYKDRYTAELTKEEQDTYEVTLVPIDDTDIYERIVISITKKKFEIAGIAIYDEAGSENKYTFDKFEINKKISKEMFEFNPPKGTEILEY